MPTKSSLQSLLTHPLAGSATAREICTSLGLTACRLKTPYTALRGIPMRLGWSSHSRSIEGNNTPTLPYGAFRAISILLHVCLVTHIVGSNLKSKNQEVSGFSDQWRLNAMVDFDEIQHKCLPTLLFDTPKFSRNLKKSKFEIFYI